MSVRIVTDSTSDLTEETAKTLGITVVPLNVHFGTEVRLDGVDLKATDFYQLLPTANPLPTTSQPSVGAFLETYKPLLESGEEIVSIHVSSKASGTYNSAIQAQQELDSSAPLVVIDTYMVSIGLGLVAKQAAKTANAGGSIEQVTESVKQAMKRVHFFGLLDTLEYLVKGGRIGKAAGFIGSLLNLKPLLTMRDGEVAPLERARSRSKGISRMVELASQLAPIEDLGVLYSTTPDEANALAERLSAFTTSQVSVGQIGPVVGTHVGPGALAVGLLQSENH